jgi:hypothetical protein
VDKVFVKPDYHCLSTRNPDDVLYSFSEEYGWYGIRFGIQNENRFEGTCPSPSEDEEENFRITFRITFIKFYG